MGEPSDRCREVLKPVWIDSYSLYATTNIGKIANIYRNNSCCSSGNDTTEKMEHTPVNEFQVIASVVY